MIRNLCIVIAFVTVSSAAWAQSPNNNPGGAPHSAAEERACSGDAHRFCKDAIGDDFRVGSCLQEHRGRLSHACRTVLEGHGM